jgi:hypothetical protein
VFDHEDIVSLQTDFLMPHGDSKFLNQIVAWDYFVGQGDRY